MTSPIGPSKVERHAPIARYLRWHAAAYVLVVLVMNVLNVIQGSPWWAFKPSMAWGLALAIHYFIFKSMTIDEDWVDDRANQVREHSYDFDHMRDLEQRISDDDFSVHARSDEPPASRRTKKD